jgi:hypothetical protein
MFKSKIRPIVITQAEHARLSGMLASLWGNADFDRPPLDFASFVLGVTFHDRGYGTIDNKPIGGVPREVWAQTQRDGILASVDDPVANIVTLMHIRRLLTYPGTDETAPLMQLADEHIQAALRHTEHDFDAFKWTDAITRWCDDVTFGFAFESRGRSETKVYPRRGVFEAQPVAFDLRDEGVIAVDPWPFAVESYQGYIIGYELDGYPERLEPVLVPFELRKG